MTQVEISSPFVGETPSTRINETEFWIAANTRPDYPSGGRLAVLDFPLSLPIDATVTIMGTTFWVKSVGLIVNSERAILVYGLR